MRTALAAAGSLLLRVLVQGGLHAKGHGNWQNERRLPSLMMRENAKERVGFRASRKAISLAPG